MTDRITLRPAQTQDFAICKRLYFENMCWIIEALNLAPIGGGQQDFTDMRKLTKMQDINRGDHSLVESTMMGRKLSLHSEIGQGQLVPAF